MAAASANYKPEVFRGVQWYPWEFYRDGFDQAEKAGKPPVVIVRTPNNANSCDFYSATFACPDGTYKALFIHFAKITNKFDMSEPGQKGIFDGMRLKISLGINYMDTVYPGFSAFIRKLSDAIDAEIDKVIVEKNIITAGKTRTHLLTTQYTDKAKEHKAGELKANPDFCIRLNFDVCSAGNYAGQPRSLILNRTNPKKVKKVVNGATKTFKEYEQYKVPNPKNSAEMLPLSKENAHVVFKAQSEMYHVCVNVNAFAVSASSVSTPAQIHYAQLETASDIVHENLGSECESEDDEPATEPTAPAAPRKGGKTKAVAAPQPEDSDDDTPPPPKSKSGKNKVAPPALAVPDEPDEPPMEDNESEVSDDDTPPPPPVVATPPKKGRGTKK